MANRISFSSDGPTTHGVRVALNGGQIPIKGATIKMGGDSPVITAEVEMFAILTGLEAEAKFTIRNPFTGKLQTVRRVEFEDGEVVDF